MQLILTPDRTQARGRRLGGAGRFAAGGFSIVELMVALAIGGFIMLLLAAVFFTSSVTPFLPASNKSRSRRISAKGVSMPAKLASA